MILTEKEQNFYTILKENRIKAVYQAIVSLNDGEVHAYEALSRITIPDTGITTEELFQLAVKYNRIWELEALCRKESLRHASQNLCGKKLFLNVDPNVIHDDKFKTGETGRYLKEYGVNPEDIVFEITERSSIADPAMFKRTINHYKKQKYHIAIDDFGEGYAGINRVCLLEPHYLKIDMAIVRGIDQDEMKKSLVESFVKFCDAAGIKLIGEGIETEAELRTLMKLGVHYGQGYYLQRPDEIIRDIAIEVKRSISDILSERFPVSFQASVFDKVGDICHRETTVGASVPGSDIYRWVKNNPLISEMCVVENGNVIGLLTRNYLMERFAGEYGYNLNSRKRAENLVRKETLVVDAEMSIEHVSKRALARDNEHVYDAIVVTKNGQYYGIAAVKDLLEAAITIQVTRATEASPLTRLPGNYAIETRVKECIASGRPFSVAYLDLDNFKAYNDAYGFNNGDLMIKLLVRCMQESCRNNEFMGHIGGDDLVLIAEGWRLYDVCDEIRKTFAKRVMGLYNTKDRENGYICAKNRNGFADTFPIATLSIAIMTNKVECFADAQDFSNKLAVIKKRAKIIKGNSIVENLHKMHMDFTPT